MHSANGLKAVFEGSVTQALLVQALTILQKRQQHTVTLLPSLRDNSVQCCREGLRRLAALVFLLLLHVLAWWLMHSAAAYLAAQPVCCKVHLMLLGEVVMHYADTVVYRHCGQYLA
jgi:hypothetical protein